MNDTRNTKQTFRPISRRTFGAGLVAAGSLLPLGTARAEAPKSGQDLKVIELFTSEGCWSCPPAEDKLATVVDDPNILGLAYHVDYWDYIGWEDPYASPEYTERQRQYARYLRSRSIYTPQMVFQGAFHAPGSRPGEMERELRRIDKMERLSVNLKQSAADMIEITLPDHAGAPESEVQLVMYDHSLTTEVLRGENAGKTLTHRNVVRHFAAVGLWHGAAETMTMNVLPKRLAPGKGYAVLVQARNSGRILGAAAIDNRA